MTSHTQSLKVGISSAITAFFLLAVMNVFAKLLSENHHVIEVAFWRNAIAAVPFGILAWKLGGIGVFKINSPKAVVTRAIGGTISLSITFAAFAAMPLPDTTTFLFISSLILPVLAYFFLKEQIGPRRWTAIGLGFIGVIIMAQPTGNVTTYGIILALSAAGCHAFLQLLLRYLGKNEHPLTVTFYFLFIGAIFLAPLMFFFWQPITWQELPLFIGVGLSGAAAQYFLTLAFRNAEAALVTVFNYSGLIWATLFGWMIWNDLPTGQVLLGGSIVIGCNIFIIWREYVLDKRRKVMIP